eukprot:15470128-Heterocapsa_arctica.AAC.1
MNIPASCPVPCSSPFGDGGAAQGLGRRLAAPAALLFPASWLLEPACPCGGGGAARMLARRPAALLFPVS